MNRQRLTLFLLVLVFGVAAVWSYNSIPRLKTAPDHVAKPVAVKTSAADTKRGREFVDDGTILNIAELDKEQNNFSGYRKNIFKSMNMSDMKAVRKKAAEIMPQLAKAPVTPVAAPEPAMPEAAPLAKFTFLGFLKKGHVKTIFLSKDKDIVLVKQGDKIAGRYEAVEISDQALTLSVLDSGDEIVIPLLENRPLLKK